MDAMFKMSMMDSITRLQIAIDCISKDMQNGHDVGKYAGALGKACDLIEDVVLNNDKEVV